MKIIVMSDLHYFNGDIENARFNTNRKLTHFALPFLEKLTGAVNGDPSVDVFVNLGDLIQDTRTKDGDLASLAFGFQLLRKLRCPYYSVLGNHDLKMMDRVEEAAQFMDHPPCCSVDIKGWHLVFLSPELRPELGTSRGGCYKAQYLGQRTLDWLQNDLAGNRLPALVFTHYAVAEDSSIDDDCMFMKDRDALKGILKADPNIQAVFSGHLHMCAKYMEDGIPYYLIGSPTDSPRENGIPEGCYCQIETEGKEVRVTMKTIPL